MRIEIEVENIKCGGCANTIRKTLLADARITQVDIDVESGCIAVMADEDLKSDLIPRLQAMGYPERGSIEGIKALQAKAKSFVSCAVGRMDKSE